MSKDILINFYRAIIESVLMSSCVVWFGGLTIKDSQRLMSVTKMAGKIIGCQLPHLVDLYKVRLVAKAKKIAEDTSHPANQCFELLPSGRRYRVFKGSRRFLSSMFPEAVKLLNVETAKQHF